MSTKLKWSRKLKYYLNDEETSYLQQVIQPAIKYNC